MNRSLCSLCIGLAVVLTAAFHAPRALAQCEEATELYRKAVSRETGIEEKIRLLEQSLKICRSYAASFELGKACAANGDLGGAESALDAALGYAADDVDKKIKVCFVMAKIYRKFGKMDEAAMRCKAALRLSRERPAKDGKGGGGEVSAEIERELMEIEKPLLEGVVPAERIQSALLKGVALSKALAVVGVVPAVDLRVHFTYDSSNLTETGRKQADELLKAMTSPGLRNAGFTLVGHTDVRGPDDYNLELSLNRARAVRSYILEKLAGGPGGRGIEIEVAGKGRKAPIYAEDTEAAHALNRRVEVVVRP